MHLTIKSRGHVISTAKAKREQSRAQMRLRPDKSSVIEDTPAKKAPEASEEAPDSPMRVAALLTVFFILNIAFNAYNKYLFSPVGKGEGFQVPILSTMSHALAGFVVAFGFTFWPDVYVRKPVESPKMIAIICGISVFFAGSIGMNNTSLQFLSLSMQQVIRSTTPAAVAICAFFIEHKRFSRAQTATLVTLVGGVMLAVLGDTAGTQAIGVILCFGSVVATSLQYTFVSITMSKENKLKGLDLLFYTGGPTLVVLTPALIANGEIGKFTDYVAYHGLSRAIGWILIGQALAVMYNLTIFTFIHSLSAVYLAVCGVFKVVLVITFSIIVFGDQIALINGIGLFIAMASFCANSYFEYTEKAERALAAESKKTDEEKEGLLAGERSDAK